MQTSTSTAPATGSGDTSTVVRTPWLRLLPEDGIFAVLLLVIMVYTTVSSIQSVNPPWAQGLSILTATTGIGLLAGYICVQQGLLPEMLVQAALVAFGCFFSFVQTADAVLGGNRAALLKRMQTWFHQAVILHQTSDDNAVFLLFLAILSFLLAFISVWLVLRTRRPWLAALANGVVLLINLNSTTDDKGIIYLVIFVLATLLLLVRFTLSENIRQWRARGLRFSPDLSWDFMQAGSIFAVVVLLLAYLLPAAEPNSMLLNTWNSPQSPWQSVVNTWQVLFNGVTGRGFNGNGSGLFGGGLQLTGNANLRNVVMLHYQTATTADDPSQYLMTQTYDTYDGKNTWHASSNTSPQRYTKDTIQQPTLPTAPYNPTTYVITLDQPQGNNLFAPGSEPQMFDVPSVAAVDQSNGIPIGWTSTQSQNVGTKYTARGYVSAATAAQLRSVPYPSDVSGSDSKTSNPQYPQGLLTMYLDNSGDAPIPAHVRDLARQVTLNSTNMYDAATSLEGYLHGYKYSLQNPDPPAGQDAISWFLFTEKQGFCTFFASAMTVMARSLGMPARVVTGYATGTYDAHSNSYIVKGTQAHVWTQIYFAGYGWINFEPTSSPFNQFSRSSSITTLPGVTPGTNPGGTPQATKTGIGRDRRVDPGTGPATLDTQRNVVLVDVGLSLSVIILLALLALAFFIVWWRLLYRGLSPVATAFARVARLGAWAGAPPQGSQTPAEYAEHLGRVVPGQRPALRELTQLYARERWGGGLPQETAGELPRLYEQVRRSISRMIVQRLRHAPGNALSRGVRRIRRGR